MRQSDTLAPRESLYLAAVPKQTAFNLVIDDNETHNIRTIIRRINLDNFMDRRYDPECTSDEDRILQQTVESKLYQQ